MTQTDLSQKIAKSRSDITNHLRLLKLPAKIQACVRDGKIAMGHARALLSISDETQQLIALDSILQKGLSVREIEQWNTKKRTSKQPQTVTRMNPLEKQLFKALGTQVKITESAKGKGKLILSFDSIHQRDALIAKLNRG